MKKRLHFIALLLLSISLHSQIVNIPDLKLKEVLINSLCVDTNGDGYYDDDVDTNDDNEIQISEAKAVLRLNTSNKSIKSLEGIEKFTELKILNVGLNELTNIDLSKNVRLVNLFINDNKLSTIDISNNLELVIFNCWGNNLTSLDVSLNKRLSILYCSSNKLKELDLSLNYNLIALFCFINDLDILNLKNGLNNKLSTIMANLNPKLKCIQVDNSKFSSENPNWLKDNTATYLENCSTLNTEDYIKNTAVNIYPNPVKNILNIKVLDMSEIESVEIFDIKGNLVISKNKIDDIIDLSELNNGIYFLKAKISNQLVFKKIIKQ